MRWYPRPPFSSSSALVARRNSKSGAPSKLDPTSSRSSLTFLSVNGTAAILVFDLRPAGPEERRGVDRGRGCPKIASSLRQGQPRVCRHGAREPVSRQGGELNANNHQEVPADG